MNKSRKKAKNDAKKEEVKQRRARPDKKGK